MMNLRFTLLLCALVVVGASGICDLDGEWYDYYSTSSNEVSGKTINHMQHRLYNQCMHHSFNIMKIIMIRLHDVL